MASGEYYLHCGLCKCKVLNTDAVKDEEKKWVCKRHVLHDLFDRGARPPVITPRYPKIIRAPGTPTFRDDALTWEKIALVWETIDTVWEEL